MPVKKALVILMLVASYATPVFSCSTPVFRYALEMWGAYAYVVEVYHDGNLDDSQQQALTYLKNTYISEGPVNIKVVEITDNHPEDIRKEDLPLMRLSFPTEHKIHQVVWQGKLTEEYAKNIIDSPSRKQVLNNISRGDAAVWLFLESGNADKDAKQLKILKDELERLSETLKLSETATDVAGRPLDIEIINTGVDFSLVQIDRNDPAEEIFISILLGTEADLKMFQNIPLAFPIFGQGRALYALAGNGIKPKNIETACSTIIGWCSCTIKDDNPGTDLLIKADWERIIGDSSWIKKEEIPDITGLGGFMVEEQEEIEEKTEVTETVIEVKEEVVVAKKVEEPEIVPYTYVDKQKVTEKDILKSTVIVEDQSTISPMLRNSLLAIALFIAVMATATFVMKRR
jgi:hypothetical protein